MSGAGLTDDEVMLAGAAMAFAGSLGRNDNEMIWWQLVKHGWTGTLAPIAEQPTLESTTYTLADAAGEPASPRTAEATSEPQQRTSAQAGAPQEPATPIQIKLFD